MDIDLGTTNRKEYNRFWGAELCNVALLAALSHCVLQCVVI